METDTNPIDRTIAHLLFHRPSDPSVMHATDTLSLKSNPVVIFCTLIADFDSLTSFVVVLLTVWYGFDRFMGPSVVRR